CDRQVLGRRALTRKEDRVRASHRRSNRARANVGCVSMKERDRVARASSSRSTTPARLLADGQSHMAPWRTLITAVHPHPSVKINHGATFLVTDQQGNIPVSDAGDYGLYSADTRFISRHELRLNGKKPDSVASVRLSFRHARWHMIADRVAGPDGDMREARVAVTVDRLISMHQMHE